MYEMEGPQFGVPPGLRLLGDSGWSDLYSQATLRHAAVTRALPSPDSSGVQKPP
jgi:hypothetical protein